MDATVFFTPELSKGDRVKLRLLQAALQTFGAKGPKAATVRDIARTAGQNVAAIAYYFGSKEELYRTVMEGIVREIRFHLADVLRDVQAARERGRTPPAEALELLRRFLRTIYIRLLSRDEAVSIARIISREHMQPGPGFEILYGQAFRELHETLCFLVGTVLGQDPRDPATIVRTHTVMGQVYFFAMSREAILRRLGWKSLEGKHADFVGGIIGENIEVLLCGLAARTRNGKPALL